jgi:hypothetical protein
VIILLTVDVNAGLVVLVLLTSRAELSFDKFKIHALVKTSRFAEMGNPGRTNSAVARAVRVWRPYQRPSKLLIRSQHKLQQTVNLKIKSLLYIFSSSNGFTIVNGTVTGSATGQVNTNRDRKVSIQGFRL